MRAVKSGNLLTIVTSDPFSGALVQTGDSQATTTIKPKANKVTVISNCMDYEVF